MNEVELVIRELGELHAAWWGDARLDQTPWLPMKGIMTPEQAPVVLIQNWESFLGKLSIPATEEVISAENSARATCLPSPSPCTRNLREH